MLSDYIKIIPLILLLTLTDSTLLIASPAINSFPNSTIPYSYANFGFIPYGKTLSLLLQPYTKDLCKSLTEMDHLTEPTYLLVDVTQGACSYTKMAINAQGLGAKGVVFVSQMVNYYGKVVQVDDGNGRKVHISVLFIGAEPYKKLIQLKNINIKVLFQVYKTQKVSLSYFLSASGRSSYIFLRQFQPYYSKLSSYINFSPLYLTFPCLQCAQSQCYISQQYCTFEMDTYKESLGTIILKEQLKQWNIWKQSGTQAYFTYMDAFDQYCSTNWYSSQACGDQILTKNKIAAFGLQEAPTEIMHKWKVQEVSAGMLTTPEITLNQQLYAGTYEPEELFNAICENLINPPEVCFPTNSTSSKLGVIIAIIVLACLLSMFIGFFIYKNCIKRELTKDMFSKVNELVARYATKVFDQNKKRKDRQKMRLNQQL